MHSQEENQQEGNHISYWKPNQLPGADDVMDLSEEPTLLKQHNP